MLSLFARLVTVTEGGTACENSSMIYVNKLEELPSTVCHIYRKVARVILVPIVGDLICLFIYYFLVLMFKEKLGETDESMLIS